MYFITLEEFKNLIYSIEKPSNWRDGQFVFNTIDKLYKVARKVQFENNIDCFYDDSKINQFIVACFNEINKN